MYVYIKTFGCTLNKFDSNIMERILTDNNFKIVNNINNADIIIVNTCGVKKQTEDKIISYIEKLSNNLGNKKKLIITGCLPVINLELLLKKKVKVDAFIGPSPGYKILDTIRMILNKDDKPYINIWSGGGSPLIPPKKRGDTIIEPIGISFGCLDDCAFCATKFARATLNSQPIDKIIEHIKSCLELGIKEFHLTSPDSGVYGFDLRPRVTIIDLLKKIEELEGEFFVRVGMMNPRWAKKWIEELIEIFRNAKHLFYYLHIPVQSGSDTLLKIMGRSHNVDDYLYVAKRLRKEVDSKFTIATDIIVGHPGEKEEDFEATLELIKSSKPDIVNISKFFPRPRTKAKEMMKLPTHVIKERSKILTEVTFKVMRERNNMWINWIGNVIIDEYGLKGNLMGRNYAYKPIAFVGNNLKLGIIVRVKVLKAYETWLQAEPLS